ncbi:MAG: hypothetical protein U0414_20170 [Polyangiaceae bacterium]
MVRSPKGLRRVALLFGGMSAVAAIALPPREARADDSAALVITAVALVSATFGWDVAFTAYDASHAVDEQEPDFGWMVAETAVTSPQTILGSIPIVLSQLEEKDDIAVLYGIAALPLSVWANAMATFSVWSMSNPSVEVGPRFGVSWMVGANLTLSTGAIASAFSDCRCTKPWLSIPTVLTGAGETIGSIYQAVNDKPHRAAWIGLSAWSGVLTLHGAGSLISWYVQKARDNPGYPYPAPYEPPPRPRPPPPSPRPPLKVPSEEPPPAGATGPRPAPYQIEISGGGFGPVTDGVLTGAGLNLSGTF